MNQEATYKVVHGALEGTADRAAKSFEEALHGAIREGWSYLHATFVFHRTHDGRFFYTALTFRSADKEQSHA